MELIKCLRAIKENAFSASPYPVILTFEDHLNPHLQAKVAQVLKYFPYAIYPSQLRFLVSVSIYLI